jgi:hypothetical protein
MFFFMGEFASWLSVSSLYGGVGRFVDNVGYGDGGSVVFD